MLKGGERVRLRLINAAHDLNDDVDVAAARQSERVVCEKMSGNLRTARLRQIPHGGALQLNGASDLMLKALRMPAQNMYDA